MNATIEHESEVEIEPQHTPLLGVEFKKTFPNGATVIGYRTHDDCVDNPLESSDAMGKIHSFNTRHRNFKHPDDCKSLIGDPMNVPLAYYEHGQCMWMIAGGTEWANTPDKQWDGRAFAGIWEADDECRKTILWKFRKWKKENNLKKTTPQQRKEQYRLIARDMAKGICEEYTAWCNGDCYVNHVEVYDKEGNLLSEDICGGFIGDYAEE
jgi:hypothetical protein